jgi:hypothetical protein
MSDNELAAFMTLMITVGVTVISIARAWMKRGAASRQAAALPHGVEDRLTRIEHAVDAIAVEVERISEGQRFTTQLLAERAKEQAALPGRAAPGA